MLNGNEKPKRIIRVVEGKMGDRKIIGDMLKIAPDGAQTRPKRVLLERTSDGRYHDQFGGRHDDSCFRFQ